MVVFTVFVYNCVLLYSTAYLIHNGWSPLWIFLAVYFLAGVRPEGGDENG